MPDKIFTPYTLGCKKCRDEFDLQNNNSFQLKQIGRRQPPDNTLSVSVGPNDSCYKNTGHKTINVYCTKHNEHVETFYVYDFDGIEEIAYSRFDQYKYDCIVHYCNEKGINLPPLEELEKYHPIKLHRHAFDENNIRDFENNIRDPYEEEAEETKKYEKLICDIYNHGEDYDEEGNYIPIAERKNHIEINKNSEGK